MRAVAQLQSTKASAQIVRPRSIQNVSSGCGEVQVWVASGHCRSVSLDSRREAERTNQRLVCEYLASMLLVTAFAARAVQYPVDCDGNGYSLVKLL